MGRANPGAGAKAVATNDSTATAARFTHSRKSVKSSTSTTADVLEALQVYQQSLVDLCTSSTNIHIRAYNISEVKTSCVLVIDGLRICAKCGKLHLADSPCWSCAT